jgi:hypothetical protein
MKRRYTLIKPRRHRILLIGGLLIALPVLFLATGERRDDGLGIHSLGRPPFISMSWGPSQRYIVPSGINVAWDRSVGAPGNVVEFPITPGTRVSLRVFSIRWFRQDLRAWASDHKRIARWIGLDRCLRSGCMT